MCATESRELDAFGSWRLHRGLLRVLQLPLTYCSTYIKKRSLLSIYMTEWQLSNYQQDTPRLNNPNTSNSRGLQHSCTESMEWEMLTAVSHVYANENDWQLSNSQQYPPYTQQNQMHPMSWIWSKPIWNMSMWQTEIFLCFFLWRFCYFPSYLYLCTLDFLIDWNLQYSPRSTHRT